MSTIELDKMDLEALKQLRKEVDQAISSFVERKRQEARAKLEAEAKAMGFSLTELVEGKGKAKGRSQSLPKYRDPEDSSNTWTGRGRQPEWFKAAVKRGVAPESMEIG